jgi:peptidoglycan/LPS O-acetylase OafA/YrhL
MLDGLRAVAIGLVLVGHSIKLLETRGSATFWHDIYPLAGLYANTGVHLFFCISGFLITCLLLNEQARNGGIDLEGFYRRRAIRIWPAFYTYLLCLALLTASGFINSSLSVIAWAGLFIWNYSFAWNPEPAANTWFAGHSWSLCVEQHFYLLWPLIIRPLTIQRLRIVCLAGLALAPAIRAISGAYLPPAIQSWTSLMTHGCFDGLLCGALASSFRSTGQADQHRRLLIGGGVGGFVTAFLVLPALYWWKVGDLFQWPGANSIRCIALTLFMFCLCQIPASRFTRWLESAPLRGLGAISYSLYLWQQPFLTNLTDNWISSLPIKLACALICALLSYRFVEKPFLRWKSRPLRIGSGAS